MARLIVTATAIKSLIGIDNTTHDAAIDTLINVTQDGIESLIRAESLADSSLEERLTLGVTMIIADLFRGSAPSVVTAGPLVEERAGDAVWKYADASSSTSSVASSAGLRAQGEALLLPYLTHAGAGVAGAAMLTYETAVKDLSTSVYDSSGTALAEGNLDLWDR